MGATRAMVTQQSQGPPISEADLKVIAERAFNPLIAMSPDARADVQALLTYIGFLRRQLKMSAGLIDGLKQSIMVVCQQNDEHFIDIPFDAVEHLDPLDQLVVSDLETDEGLVKRHTYVPATRILQ